MGDAPVCGKNFDHRKVWIEEYLQQFAPHFGLDLPAFIDSFKSFSFNFGSSPDVVATWSDEGGGQTLTHAVPTSPQNGWFTDDADPVDRGLSDQASRNPQATEQLHLVDAVDEPEVASETVTVADDGGEAHDGRSRRSTIVARRLRPSELSTRPDSRDGRSRRSTIFGDAGRGLFGAVCLPNHTFALENKF